MGTPVHKHIYSPPWMYNQRKQGPLERPVGSQGKLRTGQPAAMAGDTLRVIMDMGKFQGVIAATTLCNVSTMSAQEEPWLERVDN